MQGLVNINYADMIIKVIIELIMKYFDNFILDIEKQEFKIIQMFLHLDIIKYALNHHQHKVKYILKSLEINFPKKKSFFSNKLKQEMELNEFQ